HPGRVHRCPHAVILAIRARFLRVGSYGTYAGRGGIYGARAIQRPVHHRPGAEPFSLVVRDPLPRRAQRLVTDPGVARLALLPPPRYFGLLPPPLLRWRTTTTATPVSSASTFSRASTWRTSWSRCASTRLGKYAMIGSTITSLAPTAPIAARMAAMSPSAGSR